MLLNYLIAYMLHYFLYFNTHTFGLKKTLFSQHTDVPFNITTTNRFTNSETRKTFSLITHHPQNQKPPSKSNSNYKMYTKNTTSCGFEANERCRCKNGHWLNSLMCRFPAKKHNFQCLSPNGLTIVESDYCHKNCP